jgi:hypothetical protein
MGLKYACDTVLHTFNTEGKERGWLQLTNSFPQLNTNQRNVSNKSCLL